ncbi:MAG: hydroxymethylpyrimidine/phosphomethylpyrimidine kinase, partial [Pedosphaera parvula]|nr:hydroxymethylpyrimidine/phosphomethylpyrimidine kinase [Pedosphaera parvula]
NCPPLVVDPVMISTSGAGLLKRSAVKLMQEELLPLCVLVTPNVPEAEVLVGHPVRSVKELRAAAHEIKARYGCSALVKGGHLRGMKEAVDFFFDGRTELMLSAPYTGGVHTHGTGCTYSAAVAAHLARDLKLPVAVQRAKEYITQAIIRSRTAGRHSVLNWFGPG